MVVQSAERTGDVGALLFLDLEHQVADVPRYRVHPEGIEASFQHMGLDARLMERSRPLADRDVRILTEKEIHLFESASIGFYAVEAAHVDDCGTYLAKLVDPGNIFARTLPHIPVNQGELYFSCHYPKIIL